MESKYYDGTKLLSLNDIDGNRPEIYICTSNRSAGKTTWFNRYVVRRYLRGKGKFCLIYRYKYELQDCADKFFKEIGALFFPGYTLTQQMSESKAFVHLMLAKDGGEAECCGYAVALNSAEQVKKYSHYLNDTTVLLFDEFQSETGVYCPNEMNKFISIQMYSLDPLADGVIIGHAEGHRRGVASNHADPEYLWNAYGMGYTMDGFRRDVAAAIAAKNTDEEDDDMATRYNTVAELPAWAQEETQRLVDRGALLGDEHGNLDVTMDMLRTMIVCQRMIDENK